MAMDLEDTTWLKEELTCPVCLDLFLEPHYLRCGHNFCLRCLHRLKRRSKYNVLRCPECRDIHGFYLKWQKNLKLSNIADDFRRRNRDKRPRQSLAGPLGTTTEVSCDYCGLDMTGDSANRSKAVKTCLKCEVSMCPEHLQHHLQLPAFCKHPLVEPLSDMQKRKCIKHDEMFQYYCMDERKFLCNICTVEEEHNMCVIRTLKNTMNELQASLETQLRKVNCKIIKVKKNIQKQRKIKEHNQVFLVEVNKHVDSLKEILMIRLNRFLLSLRQCVCAYEAENFLFSHDEFVQTEGYLARLGDVSANIKQLLQKKDPYQFIKKYMSSARSYHKLLKRPLFSPSDMALDTHVIVEFMNRKTDAFMADMEQYITLFITTACTDFKRIETVEEEEEDESDENEDENMMSDEDSWREEMSDDEEEYETSTDEEEEVEDY